MKTKILVLLIVLAFSRLTGQNYYKIVFAGNPETVFVENQTQGKSVSLPGTDTLRLKLKSTSVEETESAQHNLTIYPNPMDHSCNFDFENTKNGRVVIQLFNTNGSLVHKYSKKLSQGIHHFQLSGVPSGVYVIDIKTETWHYSGSFVSTDKSNTAFLLMNKSDSPEKTGEDKIIKTSNNYDIENTLLDYRNSVELDFATGDHLKIIGYATGFDNDTLFVSPTGDQTITFAFCAKPARPSDINGNTNPCQDESGLSYWVTNVSGLTYTWTVPSDWTITAGENTNNITVTAGSTSGNITITPSNACGEGDAQTIAINTQLLPAQPTTINGNTNPCQGTAGHIYSVTNVAGLTYFWSVPTGWTITSGQNTSNITVTAGTGSGNITVTPSNDCGNGTANSFAVTTQTIPAQPSAITGNNNPCQGATGLNYSITNFSGVTYTWTVPSGWTITAGQGTNTITVTAGTSSGNISVTPSNDCGNGSANSFAVTTQTVPVTPSAGTNVPSQTQINWNWNTSAGATGYKYNTVNNYATAINNGTSTTFTQSGLTCATAYTLYVWAYNTCGNSTSLQMTQSTNGCCGSVTFIYNGSTVTYGTVTGANNRCWLDRNLGAAQVAASSTDAASYGDLFQWGRLDDGHQVRTSLTIHAMSINDVPGHSFFIRWDIYPYDWRSPQNNNLWQGLNGINNVCPDGYRLPTQAELDTERLSWSTNNAAGAFASPLKLPMAGYRRSSDGSLSDVGTFGNYWSSTVPDSYAHDLYFNSSNAGFAVDDRANGNSVRCIKD
jgi:uncharacterized protein (TIGR02145 family)